MKKNRQEGQGSRATNQQPECARCVYASRQVVFGGVTCAVLVSKKKCRPARDGRVSVQDVQFLTPALDRGGSTFQISMEARWDGAKITAIFIRHQQSGSGAPSGVAKAVAGKIRQFRPKKSVPKKK